MVKKTFSVAVLSLTLIAGGSPILQTEAIVKTVEVGEARVEIERLGSQVSIHVEDMPDGGELTVIRGSVEVEETSEGVFKDFLPTNSSPGLYTLSLESPVTLDSALVNKGVIEVQELGSYVNLDVVSTVIPVAANDSQAAFAATAVPSRTRFRYQTFIPDSESYKTRTDVVVDWGAGGTISPEFYVGETTRIMDLYWVPWPIPVNVVTKKTASSESMKLVRGSMSSSFVSFRISSEVTNPLCADFMTKGISYNFAFYVHREGTFVVKGTMLRVPNHELYTRNNLVPYWRTIFQVPNQGFQCLVEFSWDCDLYKYVTGDLVQ